MSTEEQRVEQLAKIRWAHRGVEDARIALGRYRRIVTTAATVFVTAVVMFVMAGVSHQFWSHDAGWTLGIAGFGLAIASGAVLITTMYGAHTDRQGHPVDVLRHAEHARDDACDEVAAS